MIKGFKHKGLQELFERGTTAKVQKTLHARCLRRLDALNDAACPEDMNLPGLDFHTLKGVQRFTVDVNGPWCMTFEFADGDADRVDLEQYH